MHTTNPALAPSSDHLGRLNETLTGKVLLSVAASIFVALCAHVSVPLPFTPVPLTLGNMAVVLVGLILGSRIAFAAMLLYLAEGAIGLPVFNPGGLGGLAQLLGPTGGFLFAYPFAAAIAGSLVVTFSKRSSRFTAAFAASSLATLLILSLGAVWLASLLHLTSASTLKLAVLPFLAGEIIKTIAAAGIYRALYRPRQTEPS